MPGTRLHFTLWEVREHKEHHGALEEAISVQLVCVTVWLSEIEPAVCMPYT